MKPVICISGVARGNIKRNVRHLRKAFPDTPMFFSSWEETKNGMSEEFKSTYYPEPHIHYNPWCECVTDNPHPKYHAYKKDFINKTGMSNQAKLMNATKQLIAHAYQVADLPEEIDLTISAPCVTEALSKEVKTSPAKTFRNRASSVPEALTLPTETGLAFAIIVSFGLLRLFRKPFYFGLLNQIVYRSRSS